MAEFIVPNFKFESLSKKLNTIANKCKKAGVDYRMEIGQLYPQRCMVHCYLKEEHREVKETRVIACRKVNYPWAKARGLADRSLVKEHSEYRGTKQTVMTRCKIVAA